MFRAQANNMAPTQNRPLNTEQALEGSSHSQSPNDNRDILLTPHQPPSLHDLCSVAADIKETLMAAMTVATT